MQFFESSELSGALVAQSGAHPYGGGFELQDLTSMQFVVTGTKSVVALSVEGASQLCFKNGGAMNVASVVNQLNNVALQELRKASEAECFVCTISEGDILYLPPNLFVADRVLNNCHTESLRFNLVPACEPTLQSAEIVEKLMGGAASAEDPAQKSFRRAPFEALEKFLANLYGDRVPDLPAIMDGPPAAAEDGDGRGAGAAEDGAALENAEDALGNGTDAVEATQKGSDQ